MQGHGPAPWHKKTAFCGGGFREVIASGSLLDFLYKFSSCLEFYDFL